MNTLANDFSAWLNTLPGAYHSIIITLLIVFIMNQSLDLGRRLGSMLYQLYN